GPEALALVEGEHVWFAAPAANMVVDPHNEGGPDDNLAQGVDSDNDGVDITSPTPPSSATVGVFYSHTYTTALRSNGGGFSRTRTRTGGLPQGLNFVDNGNGTATISGFPQAASAGQTFTGTVRANITFAGTVGDLPDSSSQNYSIRVSAAAPTTTPPAFTNGPPPTPTTQGTPYSFTYTASGNPTPTFSQTAGTLPPRLTLSAAA